jgi:hypothetical protein
MANNSESIGQFFWVELKPYPGRAGTVARMVVACTLTMIVVMTLRIPFAFLGVFNSLVISRESPKWLVRNGPAVIVATAAGVTFALSGIRLFYDYPVAHFVFLLAAFCLVFFLKRALANDSVAFGFGVVAVVTMTFLWDRPYPVETHLAATLSLASSLIIGTIAAIAAAWLALQLGGGDSADNRPLESAPRPARLFMNDALSNPEYIRFALKGCLAATICYAIDSAVAWPMVMGACAETCVVTSTPLSILGASRGSPRERLFTRLLALLIGGVILGMGSHVLFLPLVDSIMGFTLQFAAVSALSAWVATSTPRLSYAGTIGSMAYFFSMFQRFGVNPYLGRSRDVFADIFMAVVVM